MPVAEIKNEPALDIDVHPQTSLAIDVTTRCLIEPRINEPPYMVLPYTYFINTYKYIAIGFSTPDIIPLIMIHHIGQSFIILCADEWAVLFTYILEINSTSLNYMHIETKNLSNTAYIVYDVKLGEIIINKDNVSLTLTKNDWSNILHMGFIKSVLHYYTNCTQAVKDYYAMYMQICKENNLTHLDAINFFIPANEYKTCNYTRLFYEIGFLCKQQKRNNNNQL